MALGKMTFITMTISLRKLRRKTLTKMTIILTKRTYQNDTWQNDCQMIDTC
jgi:hypothetical protein